MNTRVNQAVQFNYGNSRVPHEIRRLRQSSLDYHKGYGQAVIHKHRWNEQDLERGLCQRCPNHDPHYESDRQYDDICFGTGYVGGFANGVITYVSIADVQEDVIQYDEHGILVHQRHPGLKAPWTPIMGEGDIIILIYFNPVSYEAEEVGERYILKEVTPVSIRGPYLKNINRQFDRFVVHQECDIDLLPSNHFLTNVPIRFDYDSIDVIPDTPEDFDPSDPLSGTYTEAIRSVRITGGTEILGSSTELVVNVAVAGANATVSRDVRITGASKGAHVYV